MLSGLALATTTNCVHAGLRYNDNGYWEQQWDNFNEQQQQAAIEERLSRLEAYNNALIEQYNAAAQQQADAIAAYNATLQNQSYTAMLAQLEREKAKEGYITERGHWIKSKNPKVGWYWTANK